MAEKIFYDMIGGSYEEALSRLMNDAFIKRFVLKFKDDESFTLLKAALQKGDIDEAFGHSHTLKGVALNLSFKKLSEKAIVLTDLLRIQNRESLTNDKLTAAFNDVEKEYDTVIKAMDVLSQ